MITIPQAGRAVGVFLLLLMAPVALGASESPLFRKEPLPADRSIPRR